MLQLLKKKYSVFTEELVPNFKEYIELRKYKDLWKYRNLDSFVIWFGQILIKTPTPILRMLEE